MKVSATNTPSGVKLTLNGSHCPIQPLLRIERGQRDAGHRGRQRERQVDQRVDDALAGERVAHQHPGDEQPEDRVEQRRGERGAEGEPVRRHARAATLTASQNAGQVIVNVFRNAADSGISTISPR